MPQPLSTSRLSTRARARPFRFAAILAGVGLMVASCGTTSGSNSPGGSGSQAPAVSPQASGGGSAGGPVTLRFAWWGNDARAATTQSIIGDFEKKYPNITVGGESSDFASYFNKLATSTAAGDAPDVITLGGAYPREYADRGALLDLKTVSDQLDTSKFDKTILSSAKLGDLLFGLPTGANAVGVIVNPAVFQAAGVPLPDDENWTWENFVSIANQITKNSPAGTFGMQDAVGDTVALYAYQRGEPLFDNDGKLGVSAGTLTDYWNMTLALRDGHGQPAADVTNELYNVGPEQTLMGLGKAGMMFGFSNLLGTYSKAAGRDLKILKAPGEKEYKQPGTSLSPSQYFSVSAKSQHPKEAALLINYLLNDADAAKKVLADRGLPSNSDMRAAIAPLLSPADKASAEFVDRIGSSGSAALPPAPKGSSPLRDIELTLDSDVLFGRTTPADAAKSFIAQMQAALSAQ